MHVPHVWFTWATCQKMPPCHMHDFLGGCELCPRWYHRVCLGIGPRAVINAYRCDLCCWLSAEWRSVSLDTVYLGFQRLWSWIKINVFFADLHFSVRHKVASWTRCNNRNVLNNIIFVEFFPYFLTVLNKKIIKTSYRSTIMFCLKNCWKDLGLAGFFRF